MSWNKLSKKELLRTLENDFAFALTEEEAATKATILAAVAEGQLKFADYLLANPEEAEKYYEEPKPPVTGEALAKTHNESIEVGGIAVQANPGNSDAPWLMKMERKNPHYEVGRYVFTKTHPFVLVDPADVSKVIKEGGFRQATPEELTEFYG